MFYGRFKNICLPNTDQDVCILNDITYLHEMSSHPYRSRFLQLRLTARLRIKTYPKRQAAQCPGRAGKRNLARDGGSRYQKGTAGY
jgi:hypothetical protein